MGYRGYEHRRILPRFPFGHGLSYTTFTLGEPAPFDRPDHCSGAISITISVPVTNTGPRPGSEVIQCYVAHSRPRLVRPPKELKAFAKVRLEPGESSEVRLELERAGVRLLGSGWDASWSETGHRQFNMFGDLSGRQVRGPAGWQVDDGDYEVLIGRSSADIVATCAVRIAREPAADGPDSATVVP